MNYLESVLIRYTTKSLRAAFDNYLEAPHNATLSNGLADQGAEAILVARLWECK